MPAFAYANGSPATDIDPTGLQVAPRQYGPAGPMPSTPITCGGPWNQWIYNYCNNCYYGKVKAPNCAGVCNYYASQYYNQCNVVKYPSPYPPIGFQPVPGGGVIVPTRQPPWSGTSPIFPSTPSSGGSQPPCWRSGPPQPLPPTPVPCINAMGGDIDGLPPQLKPCLDCCAQAGASTQGLL